MDMIDDFIARKHGTKKIEYLHPKLEPILRETYGIIVYQEQVMRIASELAGFTLGGADLLRRAMGKKIAELMAEQRKKFVDGCKERGIAENTANQIFDLMDKFAAYGFNKSHAAGYSVVAFQTGYLKAHYPAEFMAANLTSEMTSTSRIVTLIDDCKRLGVPVLPPDVNESFAEFTVIDEAQIATEMKTSKANGTAANVTTKAIRYGLGAIKNVGLGAIESIVKTREQKGKFTSIYDFCSRIDMRLANKKVLESLAQSGAMDSFSPQRNRNQLLQALDVAAAYALSVNDQRSRGQVSIFDQGDNTALAEPPLPDFQDWPDAERLAREKEFLGIYLSGHPLQRFREEVKLFSSTSLQELENLPDGARVMICGQITNLKTIVDRKGGNMAFITIEDFIGSAEAIVFSDTYSAHRELLQPDAVVVLVGTTSTREDESTKILVEKAMSLEEAWNEIPKKFVLDVPMQQANDTAIQQLIQLLRANQGACGLFFRLRNNGAANFDFRSKSLKIRPSANLLQRVKEIIGPNAVRVEVAVPSSSRQSNRERGRSEAPARTYVRA
jgi:DNA polymerase-3 subunit alpha